MTVDSDLFFLSFSDLGTEFSVISSADFEFKWEIQLYRTHVDNVKKNSITEIANKLLQNRIYKVMNAKKDYAWINYLDDILSGINNMKRKNILFGFSSQQVKNDKDIESVVKKKFMKKLDDFQKPFRLKQPKFKLNQTVKVIKKTALFQRSYDSKTESGEPRRITKINTSSVPYTFSIEGKRRPYYAQELIPYYEQKNIDTENKFDFYISETKPAENRQLRSGRRQISALEKLYRLKKRTEPSYDEWISEKQKDNLVKNAKISSFPSEK